MDTPPSNDASEWTGYETLMDEYRTSDVSCQASLDRLYAAKRELKNAASHHAPDSTADLATEAEFAIQEASTLTAMRRLSPRERKVFELIGQGLSTAAIAERLDVTTSTVETYRERVKSKLDLKTGQDLIRLAVIWFLRQERG